MKVNMTPNPLDVVTIHASQGDTEARQWEFELHNNGELIDTSDVTEQMFFKSYKGGTEQILPENGAVPVTAPFVGDIKYPDATRTEQEFLYRQSPTEEDGLAKITDIKGNTLVWNQLVPISTRATTTTNGITFTNNDDGSAKASGTALETAIFNFANANAINIKSGHKYLLKGCPSGGGDSTYQMSLRASNGTTIIGNDVGNGILFTASNDYTNCALYLRVASGATISGTYIPQLFDLTQMGLDSITDPAEFTSLFPLSYYSYNQGSLLSFNGNGIKTVGFNQWDEEWEVGGYNFNGEKITDNTRIRNKNFVPLFSGLTYFFKSPTVVGVRFYDRNKVFLGTSYNIANDNFLFTAPPNAGYLCFSVTNTTSYGNNVCINISSSKNGTYEPYTSSTLSLPISTYFPTGMKSTGDVYDELTPSKAITRIGAVDLGTLTWNKGSTSFYTDSLANLIKLPSGGNDVANMLTSANMVVKSTNSYSGVAGSYEAYISIVSPKLGRLVWAYPLESAVDGTAFATLMSGVYLYYELATPTETEITTASLVTENGEIPLSNEDGVLIGKCTEQLSENPGFIDAKIKLSDSDGTCYSNKLQLHVERSPQ